MSTIFFVGKGVLAVLAFIVLTGFVVATFILVIKWTLFLVRICWDSLAKEAKIFGAWFKSVLPNKSK